MPAPEPRRRAAGVVPVFAAVEVHRALPYGALVEALRRGFQRDVRAPVRHPHTLARPKGEDAHFLLMPAWLGGEATGVKLVTVTPDNEAAAGLPSVQAVYVLFDGQTGRPLALLDGTALTLRRTACASALAAGYLARPDASRLVMVGAGALAPHMVRAHAAVRPIREVRVWNRTHAKAEAVAAELAAEGFAAEAVRDLEAAARGADVVSCATMSAEPVLRGDWLAPGTHLDLVGAFRPTMREADDAAIRRAEVFVDTRAGALAEAGDVIQALASGALSEAAIRADLFDLCRGLHPGREAAEAITLFKSVGTALEDLAAARLVVEGGTGRATCPTGPTFDSRRG